MTSPTSFTSCMHDQMLESNRDDVKLEAMRCVTVMTAKGKLTVPRTLFPHIVKNVSSKNPELRKLIYLYLTHFADQEPDLALLPVASLQKSLKSPNPLIRSSALKILTSMRLNILSAILMATLRNSVNDLSPYVRKTVAHSIIKIYRLDTGLKPDLIEYIERLFNDKNSMVLSSAVAAFEVVCPDRLDLVQEHYKRFCFILADCNEWGQTLMLKLLKKFILEMYTQTTNGITATKDYDPKVLLRSAKPLVHSNNSAVVMAVIKLFIALANHNEVRSTVTRPLIRLLYSHREVQLVVLKMIEELTTLRDEDSDRIVQDSHEDKENEDNAEEVYDNNDKTTHDAHETGADEDEVNEDEANEDEVKKEDGDDNDTAQNTHTGEEDEVKTSKEDRDNNETAQSLPNDEECDDETEEDEEDEEEDDEEDSEDDEEDEEEETSEEEDYVPKQDNNKGAIKTNNDSDSEFEKDNEESKEDLGVNYIDLNSNKDPHAYREVFRPYIKSFYIKHTDCTQIRLAKLRILTNLISSVNVSQVLREFQAYISSYVEDKEFVSAAIHAIGRCAILVKEVAQTCLNGLTTLLSNNTEHIVSEAIVVLRSQIINKKLPKKSLNKNDGVPPAGNKLYEDGSDQDSNQEENQDDEVIVSTVIKQVTKLLPKVTAPQARATILWILAEFSDKNLTAAKSSPNVLRMIAKSFCQEDNFVKLQSLTLASKFLLSLDKEKKPELYNRIRLLAGYLFSLAKYDINHDVRDRGRFLKKLLEDEKLCAKVLNGDGLSNNDLTTELAA